MELGNGTGVTLKIPVGAVKRSQLIYTLMQYESNNEVSSCRASYSSYNNFSPVVICGPDGASFEVRASAIK